MVEYRKDDVELLHYYQSHGARHPNKPFVMLKPSHPYTRLSIRRLKWGMKLGSLKNMNSKTAERLRDKIIQSDVKYDKMRKGLGWR